MLTFLIITILWFLAGFSVAAQLGYSWLISFQVGLGLLLSALVYVAVLILPNEHQRRIFFDGPESDEDGSILAGCYNGLPISVLLISAIVWLINLIL